MFHFTRKKREKLQEPEKPLAFRLSEQLTSWVGSPASIVVHTIFFIGIFGLVFFDVNFDQILLILTTAVSLEAIYLAIFIQMTVNRHTKSLQDVGEDIEELGEEVEDLGEDIEELGEEVEDISEDIEEISEDIDKIQEEESQEQKEDRETRASLDKIESSLQALLADIEALKRDNNRK